MEKDMATAQIQEETGLHKITVYKALERLQRNGYVRRGHGIWMLDEENCPILYWLTRRKATVIVGNR